MPYPSLDYPNIRVFFPFRLTKKIFKEIGEEYAKRFSNFRISRKQLNAIQNKVIMSSRPSMLLDLKKSGLSNGVFMYSLWSGYRTTEYQQKFERELKALGFILETLHTSGHASISDIILVIEGLNPRKIIPIHTMRPEEFLKISNKTEIKKDGVEFEV